MIVIDNCFRCWTSGWGVNSFTNGQYQTILKEVDLPIVDQNTCEAQLRATRLGQSFQLDRTSFICAGGEEGKDACTVNSFCNLVNFQMFLKFLNVLEINLTYIIFYVRLIFFI